MWVIKQTLDKLQEVFGTLKEEWYNFTNTGVCHTWQPDGSMVMDQDAYIQTVKPIKSPLLKRTPHDNKLDRELHGAFWSLLGVIAYTTVTQAWIAVYVQALQRKAQAPPLAICGHSTKSQKH